MNLLQDLEYRGLIYQLTDREGLGKRLESGPITLYIGFDPTADSLHIGNLLQILLLRRFQLEGHHPIAVVGGGTGLIGDPSGKQSERTLNPADVVVGWTRKIRHQLEQYLDFESNQNPARIVNNYDWLGQIDLIPFLRDIGKHFPISTMLAKDSVKSRLELGISYTEFSYMVLQAYDFLHLNQEFGCELQAGGSDQWGNITAGTDLIRRMTGNTAFGMTLPLITNSDGSKLGKTESGTTWIDAERTSAYQFYQFWINTDDQDVLPLLKYFTFLTQDELAELATSVEEKPWERVAQRTLAREVTTLVHGAEATARAERISQALFYGEVAKLEAAEIEQGLNDVPTHELHGIQEVKLADLLAEANISPSKRRAREDIQNGAITVNDVRYTDPAMTLSPSDRIAGKYFVIRRGKNKYFLIKWQI
ncbi:MAG: tyrosine--tRNA ligase [Chloroflexota bacterium]|jgi:tyrosyl-tRNA synthetase